MTANVIAEVLSDVFLIKQNASTKEKYFKVVPSGAIPTILVLITSAWRVL